jgi:hypothetical protein
MFTRHVDALIAERATFDEIEQEIEQSGLSTDQRSALWLYAWVHVDPPEDRRRVMRQMLISTPYADVAQMSRRRG